MFFLKEYFPKYANGRQFFKIENKDGSIIQFTQKYLTTYFGIEKEYNDLVIKWVISKNHREYLETLRNDILSNFTFSDDIPKDLNIIYRHNYPVMLKSYLINSIHDIFQHDEGTLIDNTSLKKNASYDVTFSIKNIVYDPSKNKLSYKVLVTNISKSVESIA